MVYDNKQMNVTKIIRTILACDGIKKVDVAKKLETTTQNLCMKLSRGDLRESDILAIGDALGYDVVIEFRKRDE